VLEIVKSSRHRRVSLTEIGAIKRYPRSSGDGDAVVG